MRGRLLCAAGLVAFGAAVAGAASAPPEDRLLPPARHTSEKGRSLATKHARALRELNAEVYHCLPWLEVHKESIGFYRPRHVTGDVRFLSIRLYIEQEPSPEFASFTTERRASGMFSRYVGPMLQRMTRHPGLRNDDTIDGFTIILEWLKETPQARGQRPLHETIAVFVEKVDADDYLSGRTKASDLAGRARVFGFVGETALGPLKLSAWDDNFVSTFKMKDYQAEPGVACLQ